MPPSQRLWPQPPRDLAELEARAHWLKGRSLAELEAWLDARSEGPMVRRKGKVGQVVERALGAQSGSAAAPDFRELSVELKTIPLDERGKPRESTFVCSLPLTRAETLEWSTSNVRDKLAHVLWVPIVGDDDARYIGQPVFWKPTAAQEAVLRADFDDIVGLVALGHIEALTARLGRWLQARPKAAHSRVRTRAYGADGEPLFALPRGFYLRARFTGALLRDPLTLIGAE